MTLIKVVLVAALVLLAWYAAHGTAAGRHLLLRRFLGAGVLLAGVVAVLWPGTTVWLANLVGVRRGTDLVLYVALVTFGFVAVSLHARVRELQAQLTTVVREIALTGHTPGASLAEPGREAR